MNPRHPVLARLVPPRGDVLPPGFMRYRLALTSGMPCALPIALGGSTTLLMLLMPHGLARHWLDLPTDTVVCSGSAQRDAFASATVPTPYFSISRERPEPLLMLVVDRQIADCWPLVTGVRQIFEAGHASARRAVGEVIVSDFRLCVGAASGVAPEGSWIDLGVRTLGASDEFMAPVFGRSLPRQSAIESAQGTLSFALDFASAVDAAPLPDGTPLGGVAWALAIHHG